jgi:hypothetical protein
METLRPWQQYIKDRCHLHEERQINIIFDEGGSIGKTTFISLMKDHGLAIMMAPEESFSRMCRSLCNKLTANNDRDPKCIFIDLPNALPKKHMNQLYSAIELIKSGKVVDSRNHYREWKFHPPQIWVFTNVQPKNEWLSGDKWKIYTIPDKQNLWLGSTNLTNTEEVPLVEGVFGEQSNTEALDVSITNKCRKRPRDSE